jgi:hypothetical protein
MFGRRGLPVLRQYDMGMHKVGQGIFGNRKRAWQQGGWYHQHISTLWSAVVPLFFNKTGRMRQDTCRGCSGWLESFEADMCGLVTNRLYVFGYSSFIKAVHFH